MTGKNEVIEDLNILKKKVLEELRELVKIDEEEEDGYNRGWVLALSEMVFQINAILEKHSEKG